MGLKRKELAAMGVFLLAIGGLAAFWGLTTGGHCTEGGGSCSSGWPRIAGGVVLIAAGLVLMAVNALRERRRAR